MKNLFKITLLSLFALLTIKTSQAFTLTVSHTRLGATNDFQFTATMAGIDPYVEDFDIYWSLYKNGILIDDQYDFVAQSSDPQSETWISVISSCDDYTISVSVTGLDNYGSTVSQEFESYNFCIDEFYKKGYRVSCSPCPPSQLRMGNLNNGPALDMQVQSASSNLLSLRTINQLDQLVSTHLRILDMNAKTLHHQVLVLGSGEQHHKISLHTLPAGVYLVIIDHGEIHMRKKILIQ